MSRRLEAAALMLGRLGWRCLHAGGGAFMRVASLCGAQARAVSGRETDAPASDPDITVVLAHPEGQRPAR
jgi:hypothetical protein